MIWPPDVDPGIFVILFSTDRCRQILTYTLQNDGAYQYELRTSTIVTSVMQTSNWGSSTVLSMEWPVLAEVHAL